MVLNKDVNELTERTQRIVEGAHYSMREYNLKLDDVINDQRNVLYGLRDNVLDRNDVNGLLQTMLKETTEFVIFDSCPERDTVDQWDFERIERTMNALLKMPVELPRTFEKPTQIVKFYANPLDELVAYIQSFEDNEQVNQLIPQVMLSHIDTMWVKHLEVMTRLKEGIGLRSYGQEDPMRIYQREGLELFGKHYQKLRRDIAYEVIQFMKILTDQQEQQTEEVNS